MAKTQNNEPRATVKASIKSMLEQGVTVEEIMEAASKIGEEQNPQPIDRLHDTSIDITERIKTFDDAVAYLGEDNTFVKDYRHFPDDTPKDILAYSKLRVLAAALNEEPRGWRPKYRDENGNGVEYRWAPYFRAVFFGGYAGSGASAGLAYAFTNYDFSVAYASCGSRICYKREKLAQYSGNRFKDIWEDLILR